MFFVFKDFGHNFALLSRFLSLPLFFLPFKTLPIFCFALKIYFFISLSVFLILFLKTSAIFCFALKIYSFNSLTFIKTLAIFCFAFKMYFFISVSVFFVFVIKDSGHILLCSHDIFFYLYLFIFFSYFKRL